jgi:heterodisulfide reductase subunit A
LAAQDDIYQGAYVSAIDISVAVDIAGIVDVEKVTEFANGLPSVAVARNYKFVCSDPGQDIIKKDIKEQKLNRVVVSFCSPRLHELTFRRAVASAGLNPYLMEMANIKG